MIRNTFHKLFLILISVLVLNQCIDEIEFQPLLTYNEIGNFNELNSAVEYVSEIVLGHKDIFPEFSKDVRHKQSSSFKHLVTKIFNRSYHLLPPQETITTTSFAFPLDENYTFLFSREIIQPPNAQTLS